MKLPWILVALLAVAVVLMILFWPDSNTSNSRELELEAKIASRDKAIFSLHAENTKLQQKIERDSVQLAQVTQVYKKEVSRLSFNLERLKKNPVVVKVIEENPEIDSLVHGYDSLVVELSLQNAVLEKYIDSLRVDFRKVESNFEQRLQLQSETIVDQKAIIDDQRKELRKERKKVKLWKVATVVAGVGAFFLGSQL